MAGNLVLLLKGLGVGLAIAAPVGPIGVLCIRRTLTYGTSVGLASGLGAACADAVYGAIAGLGLSSVAALLLDFEGYLRLGGGAVLLALGLRILARRPECVPRGATMVQGRLAGAFTSCFLLTLTNPTTILSFVAVFAGLGLVAHGTDYGAALSLIVGVFVGSAVWWLFLSGVVGLLRRRLTEGLLVWVNRVSGAVILGFGLGALISVLA